ncbi:MAG: Nramp family divalent metal transporter, partial [Flavobacteriaceae bacterium]|nr:Nramp family divalent metal transporter [Flavobacteriaceae bacterium]
MWNKWKNIGPGVLVAAAFIGPGTVTLCTIAGVKFGFSLLWAMLLSILATIILQEMAARLGIITQQGLAAIIRKEVKHPLLQKLVVLVILGAIVIGNAAYEGGNVGGATIGLAVILGDQFWIPLLIGTIAFILLWIGNYMLLEKVLVFLVILM